MRTLNVVYRTYHKQCPLRTDEKKRIKGNDVMMMEWCQMLVILWFLNDSTHRVIFHHLNISSIWSIDRDLSGATTPGQSGPWNNSNKGVLNISGASTSDIFNAISRKLVRWGWDISICRDAVGVFCSPSRQGWKSGRGYMLIYFTLYSDLSFLLLIIYYSYSYSTYPY